MTRNSGVSHERGIREEDIFDVSLATFYVLNKESGAGKRLAWGCAGCVFAGQAASENNTYSPPAPHPIWSAHKPVRTKR
jgi:hypothetical protein